jgi:hypothetical protein
MDCRILSKAHIIICPARSLPQHGLQNGDNQWPPATCWSCPGSPPGRIAPLLPFPPCAMSSPLPWPMKSGWPHHLRRGLECLFRRVLPLDRSDPTRGRFTPHRPPNGLGRTRRAGWCPVRDGFRIPLAVSLKCISCRTYIFEGNDSGKLPGMVEKAQALLSSSLNRRRQRLRASHT